jgi:phenylpyruvate tautomerase PptA (4-oxalocrotonate tautomerase family)
MSKVRCHYCRAEIPLESARPRGGFFAGFMCSDCYGRQSFKAFVVVGLLVVPLLYVITLLDRPRIDPNEEIGHGSIIDNFSASYANGEITTHVGEAMSVFFEKADTANWQRKLFEPLDSTKLQNARFAYTSLLMDPQNKGSIQDSKDPNTIVILVHDVDSGLWVRVTQTKTVK